MEDKEFWERCGFYQKELGKRGYHWERQERVPNWYHPSDNDLYTDGHTNLPRIDLNNLFKYAVPKLIDLDKDLVDIGLQPHKDGWTASLTYSKQVAFFINGEGKDPAQALRKAIEECFSPAQ